MVNAENSTELNALETQHQEINDLLDKNKHYKEGFFTSTQVDTFEKGLNEAVVRAISAKKNEPEWMLKKRLKGLELFKKTKTPGNPSMRL